MKNTDLIAAVGGIEKAREIVAGAPSVATAYHAKRSEYIKDVHMSDFYQCLVVNYEYFDSEHGYFLEDQDVDCSLVDFITLSDLRTAIAEHDRAVAKPEFKVGDLVVDSTGFFDWLCKVDYLSSDGRVVMYKHDKSKNDTAYQTWPNIETVRHATPAEIKAGHRIDRALTGGSDDVSDIAYHVSPLTKVQCHHQWIGADVLGDTEHQYFCTYCGEKKTEAFGVKHESN